MPEQHIPADIFTTVFGETKYDIEHHGIACKEFLKHLRQLPSTQELFDELSVISGLQPSATKLRAAIAYYDSLDKDSTPASEMRTAIAAGAEAEQEYRAVQNFDPTPVAIRVINYIGEEMQLPWAWLVHLLMLTWRYEIHGWATHTTHHIDYEYEPTEPLAPPDFEYHFKVEPGETFSNMIARFKKETKEIAKKAEDLEKLVTIKKGWPKPEARKYVEWLFRNMVKGEVPEHIGHYDMNGVELEPHDCSDKKTVKDGIKTAQQLLDMRL